MAKVVTGVEITDYTEEVLKAMSDQVILGLQSIGSEAEGYAKDNCPVDTGFLRNSITYAISGQSAAIGSYTSDDMTQLGTYSGTAPNDKMPAVYIGTNVKYAPYVEYGDKAHHNVGSAHFLKNAAVNHKERYKELFRAALGQM